MIENGWRWVDNEQKIDETCESQYLIVPGLFWRLLNLMGLLHFCFWKAGGVCYFAGKALGNACEVESLMTSMIGGLQELVCSQKYNVLVVGPSMVIVFSPLVCMEELTKMWALGRPHHKRCLILAGRVDPPISPYHILNSMPSIPIKHNTCLEQPWQETTAADVWLRPLWFSPKPPDPPSKSTSTDCWAFAWDWLWATFPPCWPLLAAWGSDWSHFLNWSRSKWYCLWTSSSFLCSFFTSDHQCIQRERERVDLQDLQQYWSCCRPYISELFAARVYVLCGDVHYLDVGDLWLFGNGLEILPRVPHVGLTPSCWQNILSGESDIGTVQTAQSRTPSISIQHSQKSHPQQTDHVKFPRRVSKTLRFSLFVIIIDWIEQSST